jgi:hypothetical protein
MFFERASDRAVAGAIDNVKFHDFVFQQTQGQARASLGRLGTTKAISLASFSPFRATAGVARRLRLNTASKPSSTSCLRTR